MKKHIFNVITLLSLVPISALKAEDQVVVPPLEVRIIPATDQQVLKLFRETKDQIAVELIKKLQKINDQQALIKQLEGTLEERSLKKGLYTGLAIGAAATIVSSIISYAAGDNNGAKRAWNRR